MLWNGTAFNFETVMDVRATIVLQRGSFANGVFSRHRPTTIKSKQV